VNEFDLSVAQLLDKVGGKAFENLQLRLDIINLGNLLNKDWGKQAFSDQGNTCGQICSATIALVHTGNLLPTGVTTNSPLAQGIYTFNPAFQAFIGQCLVELSHAAFDAVQLLTDGRSVGQ
jgi:hypothetical protein